MEAGFFYFLFCLLSFLFPKWFDFWCFSNMPYEEEKIKAPRFNEKSGFYTTKKSSQVMSKIRGKNTKPEMRFRKALWNEGVRYRVDSKKIPGKPDVSIKKYRHSIFIYGEFGTATTGQNGKKG